MILTHPLHGVGADIFTDKRQRDKRVEQPQPTKSGGEEEECAGDIGVPESLRYLAAKIFDYGLSIVSLFAKKGLLNVFMRIQNSIQVRPSEAVGRPKCIS